MLCDRAEQGIGRKCAQASYVSEKRLPMFKLGTPVKKEGFG